MSGAAAEAVSGLQSRGIRGGIVERRMAEQAVLEFRTLGEASPLAYTRAMRVPLKPLVVGNWKMHGLSRSLAEAEAVAAALEAAPTPVRVVICPPATLIERMSRALAGSPVEVGAQDLHAEAAGAYTGDVCAEMLVDAGARSVIIGHSERRNAYRETDALVAAKVTAACRAGLSPIVCVGESLEQRNAGLAETTVAAQSTQSLPDNLAGHGFAVAYEPVWAIGSGRTPIVPEIEEVHRAIRAALTMRFGEAGALAPILYGGSVSPDNAGTILRAHEVGGVLVGGASLKAESFLGIIRAAGEAAERRLGAL
jgi:triosephosphate isomerase